jgi:hypothetical protein
MTTSNYKIARRFSYVVKNSTINFNGEIPDSAIANVVTPTFDSANSFITRDSAEFSMGDIGYSLADKNLAVWNDDEGSWYLVGREANGVLT